MAEIFLGLGIGIVVAGGLLVKALKEFSSTIVEETDQERALKALSQEVYLESIRLVKADWLEGEKTFSRQTGGYFKTPAKLILKKLDPAGGWDFFEEQRGPGFKELDKTIYLTFDPVTKENEGEKKRILKAVKTAFPDYKIEVVGSRFFDKGGHIYY